MDERPFVVGIGLTSESTYLLKKICGLAGSPDRVIAVHALERSLMGFDDENAATLETLYQQLEEEAKERLRELCEPVGIKDCRVIHGHPAQVLHELGEQNNALVLAVGSHGLQGWRTLLGETADAVLRDTRNSVLAVLVRDIGEQPALNYKRVLIAVDLSEESTAVIRGALRVREMYGSELVLMSAIRPVAQYTTALDETTILGNSFATFMQDAEDQYKVRLEALAREFGIEKTLIRHGYPSSEIHDAAAELGADLIALGTHGTRGLALLLGSTPNAVLHGMQCDVLAVRVGAVAAPS